MARTISAYADDATAKRVERLAKVEQRPVSQIAGAALAFYLALPSEAHAALRHLGALGSRKDVERVSHEVTRLLLHAQYELAERAAVRATRQP
jgi:hypothetical protein